MVSWRRAAVAGLGVCLGGCPEQGPEREPLEASIPEPILPTASARAESAPEWLTRLPEREATLPTGSRVWATVPRGGMLPDVGVYTVDGALAGVYALVDKLGQRAEGVPAALVHPIGRSPKLKDGDLVLFHTFETPAMLGRVSKLVPGGDIRVSYDWGGVTKEASVDHAEAPRVGLGPMAVVAFPKAGMRSRGLSLAADGTQAWVRAASGHVEVHPLAQLSPLTLPPLDPKVGDEVEAFRWASGFRTGRVVEALEPGLRYRVQHEADRPPQDYFFSFLVARP
jgi:hypothetical protein